MALPKTRPSGAYFWVRVGMSPLWIPSLRTSTACQDWLVHGRATIAGGLGDNPMGPYQIVNNFLEAAGENIIFGGGPATMTPKTLRFATITCSSL